MHSQMATVGMLVNLISGEAFSKLGQAIGQVGESSMMQGVELPQIDQTSSLFLAFTAAAGGYAAFRMSKQKRRFEREELPEPQQIAPAAKRARLGENNSGDTEPALQSRESTQDIALQSQGSRIETALPTRQTEEIPSKQVLETLIENLHRQHYEAKNKEMKEAVLAEMKEAVLAEMKEAVLTEMKAMHAELRQAMEPYNALRAAVKSYVPILAEDVRRASAADGSTVGDFEAVSPATAGAAGSQQDMSEFEKDESKNENHNDNTAVEKEEQGAETEAEQVIQEMRASSAASHSRTSESSVVESSFEKDEEDSVEAFTADEWMNRSSNNNTESTTV